MPAAKGKQSISVVVPDGVKEALDAEASARGLDRSALILAKLQADAEQSTWASVSTRLDHQDRQMTVIRESLEQLVSSLQELVASLNQPPATPPQPVYPTPAKLEDVYPELKAMRETTVDQASLFPQPVPEPPAKRWRVWPR